ncbi:MAG TPA: hypothetical protein EYN70_05510 [Planctomycetaceae bacterium]|nr:hypothetical protein [Planctomycetaceae bacterium]
MKKQLTGLLVLTFVVVGCNDQQENGQGNQQQESAPADDHVQKHEGVSLGELFPVNGVITFDGKPLADARIRLQIVSGVASRVFACDSKADGSFAVEAAFSQENKFGAPAGEYHVLVGKFGGDPLPVAGDGDADETAELAQIEAQAESTSNLVAATPARSRINEKFNNTSTTPLRLSVKAGGNSFAIDLKSDGTGTVTAR